MCVVGPVRVTETDVAEPAKVLSAVASADAETSKGTDTSVLVNTLTYEYGAPAGYPATVGVNAGLKANVPAV